MLAEHYQPLVNKLAHNFHAKLPGCVDIDDVKTSANFGLLDAIEKFDPDRGVKFSTYAPRRIHGAMIDELRSVDWVPRLERSRNDSPVSVQSIFEEVVRTGSESKTIADVTPCPTSSRELSRSELSDWMQWACKGLAPREVEIIHLYFIENASMKNVARSLDVSESRVSQMLSSILARLKVRLLDAGFSGSELEN